MQMLNGNWHKGNASRPSIEIGIYPLPSYTSFASGHLSISSSDQQKYSSSPCTSSVSGYLSPSDIYPSPSYGSIVSETENVCTNMTSSDITADSRLYWAIAGLLLLLLIMASLMMLVLIVKISRAKAKQKTLEIINSVVLDRKLSSKPYFISSVATQLDMLEISSSSAHQEFQVQCSEKRTSLSCGHSVENIPTDTSEGYDTLQNMPQVLQTNTGDYLFTATPFGIGNTSAHHNESKMNWMQCIENSSTKNEGIRGHANYISPTEFASHLSACKTESLSMYPYTSTGDEEIYVDNAVEISEQNKMVISRIC